MARETRALPGRMQRGQGAAKAGESRVGGPGLQGDSQGWAVRRRPGALIKCPGNAGSGDPCLTVRSLGCRARWGWPERLGPYRGGHRAASRGQKPTVSNGVKTNEICRFKTHWKRRGTDLLSLSVGVVFFHPAGI